MSITPEPETPEPAEPSRRRQETRARLLDAAAEVFVETGFQGASVEAVCTRAGFTRGAFYSNFENKEELFLAALSREYQARTDDIAARGAELTPLLRNRKGLLTPEETAWHVSQMIAPGNHEMTWFALETEFILLSMRDPSIVPGFATFVTGFIDGLAPLVEDILSAAGRRFTLPVEHSISLLAGTYERAMRISAVSGPDAPGGMLHVSDRIAELLFAITEGA